MSIGFEPTRADSLLTADELVAFVVGIQIAYETICDGLGYAQSDLEVNSLRHPNSIISLKGLREPIDALAQLLRQVPEMIANLVTVVARVRVQKGKLKADLREAEQKEAAAAAKIAELQRTKAAAEANADLLQALATAKVQAEIAKVEAQRYRALLAKAQAERKILGLVPNTRELSKLRAAARKVSAAPSPDRPHLLAEAMVYHVRRSRRLPSPAVRVVQKAQSAHQQAEPAAITAPGLTGH